MDSDRIKELHEQTAYPESVSVYKALLQVWNECQQEHNKQLRIADVSNSLQEHKQVIKDLIETYIINLDDDGNLKATLTELMELSDRAVKLIKQ